MREILESTRFRATAVLLVLLTLPGGLIGQERPKQLKLPRADYSITLQRLAPAIRELSDGRFLISNLASSEVLVVDPVEKTVKPVDPGESGVKGNYGVGFLFAVGKDSTMTLSQSNGPVRPILIYGSTILTQWDSTMTARTAISRGYLIGADTVGNLILNFSRPGSAITTVRVSIADGVEDTLSRLNLVTTGSGDPEAGGSLFPLMDTPVFFPDGSTAVIRPRTMQLDRRSPDGKWTNSQIRIPAVALDKKEKLAYLKRTGRSDESIESVSNWPDSIPAIQGGPAASVIALPGGGLLVRGVVSIGRPAPYYHLTSTGTLVGELNLDAKESIVGAGAHSLYIMKRGDDGKNTLSRHPWP